MPKISIKADFTKTIKGLDVTKKHIAEATVTALGEIAQKSFQKMETKYIDSTAYSKNNNYTPPPYADIPKSRKTKNGRVLSKLFFFSTKKIITRSGGLLGSVGELATTIFDRIGTWSTDDYEVRITKNKLKITMVSVKALVLEYKKNPRGTARRFMRKSINATINVWKKTWKKVFNK